MSATPDWFGFNPADTFTFVLDREIRKTGMPGGYGGFVLELDGAPALDELQNRLDLLAERFPVATARHEPRGKRWGWIPTGRALRLDRRPSPPGVDSRAWAQEQALAILHQPAPLAETLPLSFHWLGHAACGALLVRWLHPLLDARGAGLLLDFIASPDPARFQESPSLVLQKLAEWSLWKKLRYGYKAQRHNTRANALDSSLPTGAEDGPQTLRLLLRRYSPEQTARIAQLAQQHTGLAGRSLYTLGCFMRALEQTGPPVPKAGYCIPYAFNLRRKNAPTPVFGNHVSCLFAQATREQVRDRDGLMAHLLAQYRQTVQEELDFAYLPLMWLGQWLNPDRYATLLRKQRSGGELSSCWFSDIGEVRLPHGLLGAAVTGMFHLSWVTLPPGLALLSGQINGQLTLSCNYLHPAVDSVWLEAVMDRMDAELLTVGAGFSPQPN